MEKRKQPPHNGDLHDPKLPELGGRSPENRAQRHICPSPVSQSVPDRQPQ